MSLPWAEDLLLDLRLLVVLLGTFLYGFLVRELSRRREVRPRNVALRVLVLCLALFYAGCVADELLTILVPALDVRWDLLLDLGRAAALLLALPLMAQAAWRILPPREEGGPRPSGLWLLLPWAGLLLYAPVPGRIAAHGHTSLTALASEAYLLFFLHSVVALGMTGWFLVLALYRLEDPPAPRFLRWFLATLGAMLILEAVGLLLLQTPGGAWGLRAWRFLALLAGLLPGTTFLWFVLRHSLMRLTLGSRSLRRFLALLGFVLFLMLLRPLAGPGAGEAWRRLLAWGLLAALALAALSPVGDLLARRFPLLRRLLGRGLPPGTADRIASHLRDLERDEKALRRELVTELREALGVPVRFLGEEASAEASALGRAFLEGSELDGFTRIDAPDEETRRALEQQDLHAAIPLRVGGRLEDVLVLGLGPAGAGGEEVDIEEIRLLLRQLGLVLELRGLLAERLETERLSAERERLGMLGMVAASLAHEIKNPLSSMKALAQTLEEELREEGEARREQAEDVAAMTEQIERLHQVCREILAFARPGGEADGEGEATTELLDLVSGVLYVLDAEARRRGVSIDGEEIGAVGEVPGGPGTWQTVVFNLVLNAVRHAPAGSRVAVRLRRREESIVFETQNSGPPIPFELAGRLYRPFTTTGGTGLGLALVARRVEALGGEIELENEEDRIVFRVSVPATRRRG